MTSPTEAVPDSQQCATDTAMGRGVLIVNDVSGRANEDLEAALAVFRARQVEIARIAPQDPREINDIIRREAPTADFIVLGGGDGTFSRSAKAVLDAGKPLGILPLGTANDFARSLGIPLDLEAAASIVCQGKIRRIDVGLVNDRVCLNVATLGFSAKVAHFHKGDRKHRLGIFSYPVSWLDAYRRHRSFRALITCDGEEFSMRCTQLAVGSGRHYGAGLTLAEDAEIDDGWLRLYWIEPLDVWGWMRLFPALRRGTLGARPEVELRRARSVAVSTRPPQTINVDGELVGETPATFSILPNALPLFAPAEQRPAAATPRSSNAPQQQRNERDNDHSET